MPFFDGFREERLDVGPAELHVWHGGQGAPVVLLHGHPRTGATWHKVAALLSSHRTVVCPDLRGYGESSKPATLADHSQQSKRAMAGDIVQLMRGLGHERFSVAGHDRGAYVAFRLAMDQPDAVDHLVILDAVPIVEALERCDAKFAQSWWHWFFFAQADKPERAINADPNAWYGDTPRKRAQMGPQAWAHYQRAINDPATIHAMLEDYRAGLGIDRHHDEEDRAAGRKVQCPVDVLWAGDDDMEDLYGDPLAIWRPWVAGELRGTRVPCGHHIAEEAPEAIAKVLAVNRRA
jgi:haloacetate dehalogenase